MKKLGLAVLTVLPLAAGCYAEAYPAGYYARPSSVAVYGPRADVYVSPPAPVYVAPPRPVYVSPRPVYVSPPRVYVAPRPYHVRAYWR